MAIAKVILNGDTLMDVTSNTNVAGNMLSGIIGTKNDGTSVTGNIATKTSTNMTVSGAAVTAPAGYYASSASKSVASGTAGTPTATKSSVSNHTISVTPSVTNTTGYITGSTKTGTAVTVSASELVSGTKSITENGTNIDVTNYASVNVNVPSSGIYLRTFDIAYDSSYSTRTVTCNETYLECYNKYSNDADEIAYVHEHGPDGWERNSTAVVVDAVGSNYIAYGVNGAFGPVFDIMYYPNGTITIVEPSAYSLTLTATANGEYWPRKGVYSHVIVNV